ncbi:MAG: TonB family protein [Xanthomonadaceae bacterium]|nr:TonB family protein [Xanthomonadaceae bacterium]MDE1962827.1 M56 family metallopeptidase [Xanthomonadaceae bacterium]
MAAVLLDVTLGLAVALALRRPVRRLLGAGPAFTLWLWPLLLAFVPWLPMRAMPAYALPPVLAQARASAAAAFATTPRIHDIWLLLWSAGAVVALLRLAIAYVRLRRAARPVPTVLQAQVAEVAPGLDPRRLRLHPQGPAVLWAPRSLVLLPAGFARDSDPARMRMVLAHECTHLRRHDPLWSLLAEIAAALLWFHPLAWLALPRFRLDQELACDERTLRSGDTDAAAYARTLLSSTGMDVSPVLIPWLAEPQLKERLTMIRRHRTRTPLRIAGTLGLALAGTGLALAARTMPQAPAGASQDIAFNARVQPHYPKASIANKEQGTVVLKILVNPDGSVKQVDYDPKGSSTTSGNLIAAASEAAMQWHFNPAMRGGHAIESYARVPVTFSLDESPTPVSKAEAEKKASEYAKNR